MKRQIAGVCLGLAVWGLAYGAKAETPEQYAARMKPWRDARFGMFIHWGPVSLKGTEISWSRGTQVPLQVYDNLYKEFDPVKFNADEWAAVAKAAGMKYVVLTTKHHDGFCLWDTKQTDYNVMNSPFKRDVTKELAAACRKQGLAFGTYYSTCDWHHPNFPGGGAHGGVKNPEANLDRYTEYLKAQTGELIKNYGPLFTIWFDVPQHFDAARGQGVLDYLHTLQPNIVVNNRTGARGDYDTPEQKIGGFNMERPWETCMTICHQWAWKRNDSMKSLKQCVQTLLYTVGGDGNLLFNVGPQPDGQIEARQIVRLHEMGAWVQKYGNSIYETRGGPFKPGKWGVSTRKDNIITLFVMKWPADGKLRLPVLPVKVKSAKALSGGKVTLSTDADGMVITAPESKYCDPIATVIQLKLAGPAMPIPACDLTGAATGNSLTRGKTATASNIFQSQAGAYGPQKAVDGDAGTRWATDAGIKNAWLAIDLGSPLDVSRAMVDEGDWNRVRKYEIQVKDGEQWKTLAAGSKLGAECEVKFASPVKGQVFRLNILEATDGPTIQQFELFSK